MTQGSFLYFLPGKSTPDLNRELLAANPILAGPFFDLIHSPRLYATKMMGPNECKGPEGHNGIIIAPAPQVDVGQVPGYFPDRQEWRQFGGVWIGWEPGMKPGPESLRRGNQLPGYEVELGDGQIWHAPTIRAFVESPMQFQSKLPGVWGVDDKMQPTREPLEQYLDAWETSGKIWASVFGGAKPLMIDCYEWAVHCLKLNYRIGAAETALLKLFTDDTIREVLQAAVDLPLVEEADRKAGEPENPTQPPGSTST